MSDEWELSKENVQPIKRGRSTNILGEKLTLLKSSTSDDAHSEQCKEFEEMIAKAKENSSSSNPDGKVQQTVLEAYLLFFKWTRDTYPNSSEKALGVLESATKDLKDDESIKNDARYIKLWIEYADMVRAPGDIFTFMSSNKIGEKVSLFWIAWAYVAEKSGNFKLTDQIFSKGMKRQAEPRDLLQKRYQQFQRRMARHLINKQEEEANRAGSSSATDSSSSSSSTRKALGRLSKARGTGTLRAGDALSSQPARGLQSSSSQVQYSAMSTTRTSNAPQGRVAPTPCASLGNFQIFADDATETIGDASNPFGATEPPAAAAAAVADSRFENSSWKSLGTEKQRVKENAAPITKWNEGGLPKPAHAVPTRAAQTSFSIFTDEDVNVNDGATSSPTGPRAVSTDQIDVDKEAAPPPAPLAPRAKHVTDHDPLGHLRKQSKDKSVLRNAEAKKCEDIHTIKPVVTADIAPTPASASEVQKPMLQRPQVAFAVYNDENDQTVPGAVSEEVEPESVQQQKDVQASTVFNMASGTDTDGETADVAGMLSQVCDLDDEDGTINTRLAMGAINSMFCSPQAKLHASVSQGKADAFGAHETRATQSIHDNHSAGIMPAFVCPSDLSAIKADACEADASVFALNTPTTHAARGSTHTRGGTGIYTNTGSAPPERKKEKEASFSTGLGFSIFED